MAGLGIEDQLVGRRDVRPPHAAVVDMADEGKKSSAFSIVSPGDASLFEGVGKGRKVEATNLLRTVTLGVDDRDGAVGIGGTIGHGAGGAIVDGTTGLRCDGEKMIGQAGAVDGSEIVVGDRKTSRIGPIIGYFLLLRLRVGVSSAAADEIKLVHFSGVHGFEGAIPTITEGRRVIDVGHGAERDRLAGRKQSGSGAVDPGKGTEIIIEGVILADEEDDMLNGGEFSGNRRGDLLRAACQRDEAKHKDEKVTWTATGTRDLTGQGNEF